MPPLATTTCPTCGRPTAFDPALSAVAACPACGGRVTAPAGPANRVTLSVGGRPVELSGFRPTPMVFIAVALAVTAGVALAVLFAVVAAGVAVLAVAALLMVAGWGRVRRALMRGVEMLTPSRDRRLR